jgi:hypothetical protein
MFEQGDSAFGGSRFLQWNKKRWRRSLTSVVFRRQDLETLLYGFSNHIYSGYKMPGQFVSVSSKILLTSP